MRTDSAESMERPTYTLVDDRCIDAIGLIHEIENGVAIRLELTGEVCPD